MNVFIGIDQTGASISKGRAKALPLAYVDARMPTPRLKTTDSSGRALTLETFAQNAIERLLEANDVANAVDVVRSSQTAILIDSVFGLPAELGLKPGAATLRSLFSRAAHHEGGYGLKAAASFFDAIRGRDLTGFPLRECEKIAGANSVFRTQPYQRNIQCGTYRIWRDLGLHGSEWVHLRYFERRRPNRPVLFEAYPSLLWRDILKLKTRNRDELTKSLTSLNFNSRDNAALIIEPADLRAMIDHPDHADAGVLALGGFQLHREGLLRVTKSNDQTLAREGWITGLSPF